MSYALSNIKKYKNKQRIETTKVVLYMIAELLTGLSIFLFAYLYYSIIN